MEKGILTFLGKESGFGNYNNSSYIETNDNLIIIDCGYTVFRQVKEKFDLDKYKQIKIIITHLHNDHAGSLSQMILYLWFVHKKKTIVISKCKNMKKYLEITGTPDEAYKLVDGTDEVEFISTTHVQHLDSYGFKMKINNKIIIYTGDTNTLEPFIPFLNNIDELYVDISKNGGAHLKFEDIIKELEKIKNMGIKIFLMHIDDKEYIDKISQGKFF